MSIDDGIPILELPRRFESQVAWSVVILTAVNDILVSLCSFLGRELDSGGRPERLVETGCDSDRYIKSVSRADVSVAQPKQSLKESSMKTLFLCIATIVTLVGIAPGLASI
jgi:hypothetical protein